MTAGVPPWSVQELSSKLTNQLADLTSMVRRDLGGEARKKVNTLIITDVHARDIIETFVRDSVMDAREFAWESQLRYYWDRTADDLMIRQCTGKPPHMLTPDLLHCQCTIIHTCLLQGIAMQQLRHRYLPFAKEVGQEGASYLSLICILCMLHRNSPHSLVVKLTTIHPSSCRALPLRV